MNYKKWNNLLGWLVFAIAAFTYISTVEPTASFWDCGEYIATSYRLEVGHPPGAPTFLLVGRLFSMFAHWTFPDAGMETWGEWGRAEEPESLRDFLETPHHSRAYTFGLRHVRPITTSSH